MKPDWLKVRVGGEGDFARVKKVLEKHGLRTVCEEARCPNRGECWGAGTATFMILGSVCTRNCGFCAVKNGSEGESVEGDEPQRLADAVRELGLEYVVLTSVDRDDLPDKGAGHYADCIRAVKGTGAKVEALIPDYVGSELRAVVKAGPDVLAHNLEVVRRLQHIRDGRTSYDGSLRTLAEAKMLDEELKTKSSIMLGLGETRWDVLSAMDDLRSVDCDILVLGQYLQPTKQQVPAEEYVTPEQFREYGEIALEKGFKEVVSEPLARTSYHAADTLKNL